MVLVWMLRRKSRRLPQGPYPLPIIGNLHQLRLPVHRCLKDLSDKYGSIMFMRFGSVPTVVVSSSEIAKQFLFDICKPTFNRRRQIFRVQFPRYCFGSLWRSLEENEKTMRVGAPHGQENRVLQEPSRERSVCRDAFNLGKEWEGQNTPQYDRCNLYPRLQYNLANTGESQIFWRWWRKIRSPRS